MPDPKRDITPDRLRGIESARLLIERATQVRGDFVLTHENSRAIASVCRRLDGIPLAIELAAARARTLSVEEIDTRLDQRFRLLTGGSRNVLPRQQTLRSLIDWSYNLLNPAEKTLLGRLSIFAGGWTLEAAERVCSDAEDEGVQVFGYSGIGLDQPLGEVPAVQAAHERPSPGIPEYPNTGIPEYLKIEDWDVLDLLTSLADKSLVIVETRQEPARYTLLETVKQYARDRLEETGSAAVVRGRHSDYFAAKALEIRPKLVGADQARWLSALETEHDNLRTALEFCLEAPDRIETALQMGTSLHQFWELRGYLTEGRERWVRILQNPAAQTKTRARTEALNCHARLERTQGNYAAARASFDEAYRICRENSDVRGMATALNGLGIVSSDVGAHEAARSYYEQSLAAHRELGNSSSVAVALNNLGIVACDQGDYPAARKLFEESLAVHRELGNRANEAANLAGIGNVAYYLSDYETARDYYQQSLDIRREIGNKLGIGFSINSLGAVAIHQGHLSAARDLFNETLQIQTELGNRHGVAIALCNLGNVATNPGNYSEAQTFYEDCLAIRKDLDNRQDIAASLADLGSLAQIQGDSETARRFLEQSADIQRELEDRAGLAKSLLNLGYAAITQKDCALARKYLIECLDIRTALGSKRQIADALDAIGTLAKEDGSIETALRLWAAAKELREAIGEHLADSRSKHLAAALAAAQKAVGEDEFNRLWNEGCGLSMERAVQLARGA